MPPGLDHRERSTLLDRLATETFDCLIIGGGITGAGIAREAAGAGYSVALLEAHDYASGTSSRSSKLIHGGLRYLPQGDVALVRRTALERKVIHRLAKHLCEPRWMVFPTSSRRAAATMRVGVTTYEKLGSVEKQDVHQTWGPQELANLEPTVRKERFNGAIVFREYLTDDARLVLANLRAAAGDGAAVLNRLPVTAITGAEQANGVEATCALTGRSIAVKAKVVVNAAGPWVDAIRLIESVDSVPALHLAKGIHIVVPAGRLPITRMISTTAADKRTVFMIRRGDCVYIGTTDTTYDLGAGIWPEITEADVKYLLDSVETTFDVPPLHIDDVVAAWAGLRPLIAEEGKEPDEISRKDEVWVGPKGVVTVAGGKLTGYRPMAHDVLDNVAELGGLVPSDHAEGPVLPGGDFEGEAADLASSLVTDHGLTERVADRLARLYGSETTDILALGTTPLLDHSPVLSGELRWAVEVEGATSLEDVFYRRTRCAWFVAEARRHIEPMAEMLAPLFGWTAVETTDQIKATESLFDAELAFKEPR